MFGWRRGTPNRGEGVSRLAYSSFVFCCRNRAPWLGKLLSLLSDSNQRPRDYKSRALAN